MSSATHSELRRRYTWGMLWGFHIFSTKFCEWIIFYFLEKVQKWISIKKSGAFYDLNSLKVVKRGKCDAAIFLTLRHPLYDLKKRYLCIWALEEGQEWLRSERPDISCGLSHSQQFTWNVKPLYSHPNKHTLSQLVLIYTKVAYIFSSPELQVHRMFVIRWSCVCQQFALNKIS